MHKPVCVPCGLAMIPHTNGIGAVETKDRAKQEEYRIWQADMWICTGCKHKVLSGYGDKATYPHEDDYEDRLSAAKVIFY